MARISPSTLPENNKQSPAVRKQTIIQIRIEKFTGGLRKPMGMNLKFLYFFMKEC